MTLLEILVRRMILWYLSDQHDPWTALSKLGVVSLLQWKEKKKKA